MKSLEAKKLKDRFNKRPFEHQRNLEKETDFNGSPNGDMVCTVCGMSWTDSELDKDEEKKWCKKKSN